MAPGAGSDGDWTYGISQHNIDGQYPAGYLDGKKVIPSAHWRRAAGCARRLTSRHSLLAARCTIPTLRT